MSERAYIEAVSLLLEYFWSLNIPSIAACDFEGQLAKNGGYRNELVPWPYNEPGEMDYQIR